MKAYLSGISKLSEREKKTHLSEYALLCWVFKGVTNPSGSGMPWELLGVRDSDREHLRALSRGIPSELLRAF